MLIKLNKVLEGLASAKLHDEAELRGCHSPLPDHLCTQKPVAGMNEE